MTGTHKPNPTNWDEYQYGIAASPRGSVSSMGGRSVRFSEDHGEETHLLPPTEDDGNGGNLLRRRSSVALRLGALAEVGGVNSIRNFAESWTRAAGFAEVVPHRSSFVLDDEQGQGDEDEQVTEYGKQDVEHGRIPRMSLIRAHLEASRSPEDAIDDETCARDNEAGPSELHKDPVSKRLESEMASTQGSVRGRESIFAIAPHLATPLAGSYGTSYGTLHSTLSRSSMQRAGHLWREQQAEAARSGEGDRQPILVKEIEQDGKIVLQVEGQSTLPQTIFNSTNVLIGVGLLSLPMGIKYSGWICGSIFLLLAALVTSYTAKLLAKCMDVDVSLMGFADLAFISFGQKARVAVSVLFFMELLAACVALVVLFADTLHLLIPLVGVTEWKIICGLFLIPLSLVPLNLLSFSSVVGIFSCFSIVTIIFIDGFIKPHAPGSLRDPAATYLFPNNWKTLPLSFGLLMSPWGGHSVFPNIYRDMRHPHKFNRSVKYTFSFTYFLDAITMVAGYLMFGDGVLNELTANILDNASYPKSLSVLMCVFIAIIPLTKIPLNGRPIISMIDRILGLETKSMPDAPPLTGLSNYSRGILKALVRVLVVIMFVIIAILFPEFDSIMAFMGSALCFTICIILPVMFYLKIFGKEISAQERIFCIFLVVISSVLALVGTVFAFLPKSIIGAE